MNGIVIDIGLCLITYAILIRIILWRKNAQRNRNSDNDDEGGIPAYNGPKLDLPPGVCLPSGSSPKNTRVKELV